MDGRSTADIRLRGVDARFVVLDHQLDAGFRLLARFHALALEERLDLKRHRQRILAATSRVGLAVELVRLDAIAPRQHGVAAPPVLADHGFDGDIGKLLHHGAGFVDHGAGLGGGPVPVVLLLLVLPEGRQRLGQQIGRGWAQLRRQQTADEEKEDGPHHRIPESTTPGIGRRMHLCNFSSDRLARSYRTSVFRHIKKSFVGRICG